MGYSSYSMSSDFICSIQMAFRLLKHISTTTQSILALQSELESVNGQSDVWASLLDQSPSRPKLG